MSRFDMKISDLISEGMFGSFVKNLTQGVGAAISAAEDPSKGEQMIRAYGTNREKSKEDIVSKENPVKRGEWVVYLKNLSVVGKVLSSMDGHGQFKVQLLDTKDGDKFSFVKTKNHPVWRIEDDAVILARTKTDPPTQQVKELLVGKTTNFPEWMRYKEYLKSKKRRP